MDWQVDELLKTSNKRRNQRRKHKRRRICIATATALVLLVGAVACFVWWRGLPRGNAGSHIVPTFTSDAQEARAVLDDYAQESRITVSLIPHPSFDEQTGTLAINFVVSAENNGFAERFVLEQDGHVVYESKRVDPGNALETIEVPRLHTGVATATVYAVDDEGNDYGNPVSVELDVCA